jgi:hypothetical protein
MQPKLKIGFNTYTAQCLLLRISRLRFFSDGIWQIQTLFTLANVFALHDFHLYFVIY